ncbi:glycosyltransferase family 32 protein [Lutibacter sp.]|uniref:glycosyltransferase family 32 protein n=1 Tax=Lutibacter sp. TaxID=1925666 RepID=UPI002734CE05|nr:glycosyltransferase [Lutibacter sp.]MDP3312584.1 glycosyltransferase [Lutibacter sp.]
MSIPKKIHYCWFGKQPYPELIEKCISSWEEHLRGYEFVRWDESNSPMELPFVKDAYKKELWAFVSDYVRLKALYDYGGIYLDTDMFAVKSIDELLTHECFFGSESETTISCGIIGVSKGHPLIGDILKQYNELLIPAHYKLENIAIPVITTKVFREQYYYTGNFLNKVSFPDIVIYPKVYFYPYPNSIHEGPNFYKYIVPETYMVHLWAKSWKEVTEFTLIKRKQYFSAFKKMARMILKHRVVDISYYKKIVRTYIKTRKN